MLVGKDGRIHYTVTKGADFYRTVEELDAPILASTVAKAMEMPRGEATDAVALSLYGARAHHGAQPLPEPWEAAPSMIARCRSRSRS